MLTNYYIFSMSREAWVAQTFDMLRTRPRGSWSNDTAYNIEGSLDSIFKVAQNATYQDETEPDTEPFGLMELKTLC